MRVLNEIWENNWLTVSPRLASWRTVFPTSFCDEPIFGSRISHDWSLGFEERKRLSIWFWQHKCIRSTDCNFYRSLSHHKHEDSSPLYWLVRSLGIQTFSGNWEWSHNTLIIILIIIIIFFYYFLLLFN